MRTKEQYIQGLAKMKRNIYFDGAPIDRTDEIQMDCINTTAPPLMRLSSQRTRTY